MISHSHPGTLPHPAIHDGPPVPAAGSYAPVLQAAVDVERWKQRATVAEAKVSRVMRLERNLENLANHLESVACRKEREHPGSMVAQLARIDANKAKQHHKDVHAILAE